MRIVRRTLSFSVLLLAVWWVDTDATRIRRALQAPMDIFHGVATSAEMHQIKKVVLAERALNGRYPSARELASVLARYYPSRPRGALFDSWDSPYFYLLSDRRVSLHSSGPDHRMGTRDDLILSWEVE